MTTQSHHEVHVLQNSQWGNHVEFASGEKDLAIKEPVLQDDQAGNDAVKVAREVYYPAENSHRDFVIYKRSDLNFAIKKREQQVVQKITGTNDDSDDD